MDASALADRLTEPGGWASVMKGMFRHGRAARAHAIYTNARHRGVYDNHELRFTTHGSLGYAVMAFRTTGPLDPRTRELLADRAGRFPPGTIRYEATAAGALTPRRRHPASAGPTIHAIGDPHPGVLVYVCATSPDGPDRPLVVHAAVDGADGENQDYVYPVPGDRLR